MFCIYFIVGNNSVAKKTRKMKRWPAKQMSKSLEKPDEFGEKQGRILS